MASVQVIKRQKMSPLRKWILSGSLYFFPFHRHLRNKTKMVNICYNPTKYEIIRSFVYFYILFSWKTRKAIRYANYKNYLVIILLYLWREIYNGKYIPIRDPVLRDNPIEFNPFRLLGLLVLLSYLHLFIGVRLFQQYVHD